MSHDASAAFFSYSREDSEFALRLADDLKSAGAEVWIDQLDIVGGEQWVVKVEGAMRRCPRMIVILSPPSAASPQVRAEYNFALENGKTVIPILYRDCDIPYLLRPIQRMDFRSDYARGLKELVKALSTGQLPEQGAVISSEAAGQIQAGMPNARRREGTVEMVLGTKPGRHGAAFDWVSKLPLSAKVAAAAFVLLIVAFVTYLATVTATMPTITVLSPAAGPPGTIVAIKGKNFGASQGTGVVQFGAVPINHSPNIGGSILSWSSSEIKLEIPVNATTGTTSVVVGVRDVRMAASFEVTEAQRLR